MVEILESTETLLLCLFPLTMFPDFRLLLSNIEKTETSPLPSHHHALGVISASLSVPPWLIPIRTD